MAVQGQIQAGELSLASRGQSQVYLCMAEPRPRTSGTLSGKGHGEVAGWKDAYCLGVLVVPNELRPHKVPLVYSSTLYAQKGRLLNEWPGATYLLDRGDGS
ncbi:hypothetical protein CRG98_027472 [Punica granatum]|uniref:Uncharacterized protein n=1 Tax=Punica granatum TaxID=22663 RepID=A0A2I0J8N3_PUNGR|nr:hypothetical protein CRG98_027472 [Punica granatum]